jgi:hypothetical protein
MVLLPHVSETDNRRKFLETCKGLTKENSEPFFIGFMAVFSQWNTNDLTLSRSLIFQFFDIFCRAMNG